MRRLDRSAEKTSGSERVGCLKVKRMERKLNGGTKKISESE